MPAADAGSNDARGLDTDTKLSDDDRGDDCASVAVIMLDMIGKYDVLTTVQYSKTLTKQTTCLRIQY